MRDPWERDADVADPWERGGQASAPRAIGAPEELTTLEKLASALPDWMAGSGGGVRGSAIGRLAMGAAEPGVAAVQLAANLVGQGDAINRGIKETEDKYQAARAAEGSTGFDPLRMAGNVGMSIFGAAAGSPLLKGAPAPVAKFLTTPGATIGGMASRGAVIGGANAALNPVVDGGDNFFSEKGKQIGFGSLGGAVFAPVAGGLARVVSPKASVNPNLEALQAEGVKPTIGQALGGWANAAEEKLQGLPIMGDAIRAARSGASDKLRKAAIDRAAKPIGATIQGDGADAVGELAAKIGQRYDEVLPKMRANLLDGPFVDRLSELRRGVQQGYLPQETKAAFDAILEREIAGRMSPNGTISGQGLKDAWIRLRDIGADLSKSPDAYQQGLGNAVKQTLQELKDQVSRSSAPADVLALKNADLAWANFKRVQRAASSVAADEGKFTPAMLHSAVKAADKSKDKARFAEGRALMQDLSGPGRAVLTNKVPDSGTMTRLMWGVGGLASGAVNPAIPAALVGGAAAYAPQVQNALVALLTRRPDFAPRYADMVRRLAGPAALAGGQIGEATR